MTSLSSDISSSTMLSEHDVAYQGAEDIVKQENDIHISVIKPVIKRTIPCVDTESTVVSNSSNVTEKSNSYIQDSSVEYEYASVPGSVTKSSLNDSNVVIQDGTTFLKKFNFTNLFNINKNNNKVVKKKSKEQTKKMIEANLFKVNENATPKVETLYKPKLEKYVEVVSLIKENVNVDSTYLIPKPVIIPVEVPVLKFKDNFKIVPIRKKIIPVLKYTDDVVYVDCCVEKPYIVYEDIVLPVPFDVPIEQNEYIEKAPPISL